MSAFATVEQVPLYASRFHTACCWPKSLKPLTSGQMFLKPFLRLNSVDQPFHYDVDGWLRKARQQLSLRPACEIWNRAVLGVFHFRTKFFMTPLRLVLCWFMSLLKVMFWKCSGRSSQNSLPRYYEVESLFHCASECTVIKDSKLNFRNNWLPWFQKSQNASALNVNNTIWSNTATTSMVDAKNAFKFRANERVALGITIGKAVDPVKGCWTLKCCT